MRTLGIVGMGFVGEAVEAGMSCAFDIETYDIAKSCTCTSVEELVNKVCAVFVCVPSPMRANGACDTSIVTNVIDQILAINPNKLIIVKSTVPPQILTKYSDLPYYHDRPCNIVFNPEFLTEANYIDDFKNQDRIILGGHTISVQLVSEIYETVFPYVPIISTDLNTAAMIKYATNTFLAMKVVFANEIAEICDRIKVHYDIVRDGLLMDKRLGQTHWIVPGPDGHYGFGGSCFPKDINALRIFAHEHSIPTTMLDAIWQKNLEIRPEKDWENLKGRAVV